jgi:hypothetical protein
METTTEANFSAALAHFYYSKPPSQPLLPQKSTELPSNYPHNPFTAITKE